MPASEARRRRHQQKLVEKARLKAKHSDEERPLQAVPDPEFAPEPDEPDEDEINFLLPPGGMMGGRTALLKKTLNVPGPLNAHLLLFQARYQGQRYKVQNGSLALWRMLLREEAEMRAEALRLQHKTGVPAEPRKGPVMRRFEDELDRMDAEASGDIFNEG